MFLRKVLFLAFVFSATFSLQAEWKWGLGASSGATFGKVVPKPTTSEFHNLPGFSKSLSFNVRNEVFNHFYIELGAERLNNEIRYGFNQSVSQFLNQDVHDAQTLRFSENAWNFPVRFAYEIELNEHYGWALQPSVGGNIKYYGKSSPMLNTGEQGYTKAEQDGEVGLMGYTFNTKPSLNLNFAFGLTKKLDGSDNIIGFGIRYNLGFSEYLTGSYKHWKGEDAMNKPFQFNQTDNTYKIYNQNYTEYAFRSKSNSIELYFNFYLKHAPKIF